MSNRQQYDRYTDSITSSMPWKSNIYGKYVSFKKLFLFPPERTYHQSHRTLRLISSTDFLSRDFIVYKKVDTDLIGKIHEDISHIVVLQANTRRIEAAAYLVHKTFYPSDCHRLTAAPADISSGGLYPGLTKVTYIQIANTRGPAPLGLTK